MVEKNSEPFLDSNKGGSRAGTALFDEAFSDQTDYVHKESINQDPR